MAINNNGSFACQDFGNCKDVCVCVFLLAPRGWKTA